MELNKYSIYSTILALVCLFEVLAIRNFMWRGYSSEIAFYGLYQPLFYLMVGVTFTSALKIFYRYRWVILAVNTILFVIFHWFFVQYLFNWVER